MTALAEHAGGAVVGDTTATATGDLVTVGTALTDEEDDLADATDRVAVGDALAGPDDVTVGKTVAIAGSGVEVTGT